MEHKFAAAVAAAAANRSYKFRRSLLKTIDFQTKDIFGTMNEEPTGRLDLNLLAIKLLAPGGMLLTWSCSGAMTAELFQKVVAGAALDAGRTVRIVDRLTQPGDHPVPLAFPEAEYLKGLVLEAE